MSDWMANRVRRTLGAGYLLRLALLTGVYLGAAKAGLTFAFANQSVTSIWPPTGLALAAVVIWGYRMWPGVAAGAFVANFTTAGSLPTVMAIATGNTLEAVVGSYLLLNVAHFRPSLERVRDVLALVLLAGALSTAISATIGVASLASEGLVPSGDIASTWRVWWFGDLGGDLVVASALLILASRPRLEWRPWIRVEAIVLFVLLIGVSVGAFAAGQPSVYAIMPVLVWIAFRYRQPGTAVAGLITSAMAIWFTARGHGPFVGGSEDAELIRAQTFVGIAMVTGLVVAALASERRSAETKLRHAAEHDPLTGLANRRRFARELERSVAYNSRYGGHGAVLVLDVDRFKRVNDTLGHSSGDELIVKLGRLLRSSLRETDVVGRWGGDEFTVLLPQASEEEAMAVATRLLRRVREEVTVAGGEALLPFTVSIGVTPFGEGIVPEPGQILRSADAAMYQAKAAGRDRVGRSELGWKRAEGDRVEASDEPGRRAAPGR